MDKEKLYYLKSIARTLVIILIFAFMMHLKFGACIMDGNEMFPALKDGDLAVIYKTENLVKGDVVFYTYNGEQKTGRVAAKGNDLVSISDEGVLSVNGTPQTEEIIYPTYPVDETTKALTVPEGHVFLLSDFRIQAEDSRHLGCIDLSNIKGKVVAIIRHRGI